MLLRPVVRSSARARLASCALTRRRFSTEMISNEAESARIPPAQAETLHAIGTRAIFDSDHDQFRELCRSFFKNEVAPFHAEWEKAGEVPRELWLKAGELGL